MARDGKATRPQALDYGGAIEQEDLAVGNDGDASGLASQAALRYVTDLREDVATDPDFVFVRSRFRANLQSQQ